jgi:hypothetical protein
MTDHTTFSAVRLDRADRYERKLQRRLNDAIDAGNLRAARKMRREYFTNIDVLVACAVRIGKPLDEAIAHAKKITTLYATNPELAADIEVTWDQDDALTRAWIASGHQRDRQSVNDLSSGEQQMFAWLSGLSAFLGKTSIEFPNDKDGNPQWDYYNERVIAGGRPDLAIHLQPEGRPVS